MMSGRHQVPSAPIGKDRGIGSPFGDLDGTGYKEINDASPFFLR